MSVDELGLVEQAARKVRGGVGGPNSFLEEAQRVEGTTGPSIDDAMHLLRHIIEIQMKY